MRPQHRAHAYCPRCGGACCDPDTLWAAPDRPLLDVRPMFTGPGEPSFKPSRKSGRFD